MGGDFWTAVVFVLVGLPVAFLAAAFLAVFPFFIFSSLGWFLRKLRKKETGSGSQLEPEKGSYRESERKAG